MGAGLFSPPLPGDTSPRGEQFPSFFLLFSSPLPLSLSPRTTAALLKGQQYQSSGKEARPYVKFLSHFHANSAQFYLGWLPKRHLNQFFNFICKAKDFQSKDRNEHCWLVGELHICNTLHPILPPHWLLKQIDKPSLTDNSSVQVQISTQIALFQLNEEVQLKPQKPLQFHIFSYGSLSV